MRVLVTGGTSFVGSALVRTLAYYGHDVLVLTHRKKPLRRLLDVNYSLRCGDIRDPTAVQRVVDGCDAVIHAAYAPAVADPMEILDTALVGTRNVLRACDHYGVRDLMLISSPLAEDLTYYGTGKRASELMAQAELYINFDRVVIARLYNAYGPDMGDYHVIPQFILRMLKLARREDDPIPFPIREDSTRSFIYIDDVGTQLADLFLYAEAGTFNVGTYDYLPVATVAEKIAAILGREVDIVPGIEATRTRKVPVLPFVKQKTEFDDGLLRTVQWYQEHEGEFSGRSF